MATATAAPTTASTAPVVTDDRSRTIALAPALAVAAFASLGAGAIHAAAIGVHSEHRQAVIAFTIVAAIQLGWGVLALMSSNRAVPLAGAVANAAILAGWVLAKTNGIGFVDGLETVEDVQLADALAATLAAIAVVGAGLALLRRSRATATSSPVLMGIALATAMVTIPGMVAAGSHSHAGGHGTSADGHAHDGGSTVETEPVAAVAPKPYDPTKPIDLGGVPGVTPEQQARAENLIAITLLRLPQFADPAVAEAAGYRSIGDAATGDEHYVNTALFDDGRILNPDFPESLVYQPDGQGGKKLGAAMYMMPTGSTLADVPDIGGKLTQWHIHNNLCFTSSGRVAGLTDAQGACQAGLNKGTEAPMIHVWIIPHKCGPFAALEGVGAGQIAEGETRLCDHAHS